MVLCICLSATLWIRLPQHFLIHVCTLAILVALSDYVCFCHPVREYFQKFRFFCKSNCVTRSLVLTVYTFLIKYAREFRRFATDPKTFIGKKVALLNAYNLETSDGYILTLHRLANPGQKVVYIQHGLMCSSADFLVKNGVAYQYFKRGYDVWLGNFRGNIFSNEHRVLKPEDPQFWQFTWDQHAEIDLPEMINFVREETGQDKIEFCGHSMGTTTFFVMMHKFPEMNEKIILASLLAPVTDIQHMKGIPKYLVNIINKAIDFFNW